MQSKEEKNCQNVQSSQQVNFACVYYIIYSSPYSFFVLVHGTGEKWDFR